MRNGKLITTVLLVAALMVSIGFYFYPKNASTVSTSSGNQELSLVPPAFASDVSIMATSLQQEAGMSIWLNATADGNVPLNVDIVKNKMASNLENVTSDYVIGSIPLAGFGSDDYPHCFVHKSGWIIVYFLRINTQNPSTAGYLGKMINLSDAAYYEKGNLKNNILQKGLETMCAGLLQNTPTTDAKYYNFQYPNAAKLMIAIKEATDSAAATFNIQVPGGLTIDERSWSFYASYSATFKIDTDQIYSGSGRHYGGSEITLAVLPADGSWHTVTLTCSGYSWDYARVCILILYH